MVKQMAFWLMAGWSAVAWAQADGSARPMFKVGEVAVYTVTQRSDNKVFEEVTTVTAVTPDAIRFNHVRPNREPAALEAVFTPDLRVVQSGFSGTRFDPPIPQIKVPMAVGDSWKAVYESVGQNQARSKGDFDAKVVATEKVTTPAGTFDTFRIESGGWVTGISWTGSVRVAQVQWYAPSIGRLVRTEFKDYRGGNLWTNTATELKSFQPAP